MEFQTFNKIPRLRRDCVITEKLDGTNFQLRIINSDDYYKQFALRDIADEFFSKYCLHVNSSSEIEFDLYLFAGSRNRWINTQSDNYGSARWAYENARELFQLGEGHHYAERYGNGIQRNYGLKEKRVALFNVNRWHDKNTVVGDDAKTKLCPSCCEVVHILYRGPFDDKQIDATLNKLKIEGSKAVPNFMNPEGIVLFHVASGQLYKQTIENDEKPKGITV